jgi:hypothetical protein
VRSAWIIAAAAVAGAVGLTGWLGREPAPAIPVPQASGEERPPGFWVREPDHIGTEEERDRIARLEAIGYLPGGDPAEEGVGVGVTRRTDRASSASRLYVSGDAPEATLIDADGRVLHRWRFDPREVWKDVPEERERALAYFRRAYLLDGGELLAIVEAVGILKLDRNSNLLWQRRNGAHHAAHPLPDGRIYLLTRTAHVVPAIDPERPILEDFVVVLDRDGRELRRVSLVEALLRSDYAELADEPHPDLPAPNLRYFEAGDIYHTNSIQVLSADHPTHPELRAGRVLVSSRHLSALIVIDLDERRVVWLLRGDFLAQHDAQLLANGNLLLFDNHTPERGSRALELSVDGERIWQYPPAGSADAIYSGCCSTVERLPNGNTLIAITDAGRAIEVTPTHEIVWEFRTPHRVEADALPRHDLVAALFALTSVSPSRTAFASGSPPRPRSRVAGRPEAAR